MKNDKLTGPVKDGLFYPINPNPKNVPGTFEPNPYCDEFEEAHPTMPIFDTSGIPVKDAEKVEAEGPYYQYYSNAGVWITYEYSEDFYLTVQGYETRQIYILTVSPTEQKPTYTIDGKPCSEKSYHDTKYASNFIDVGHAEKHTAPLSDKSDVDETFKQRAILAYPDSPLRQICYIQGATDQEKLMQGEIDRLHDLIFIGIQNKLWHALKKEPLTTGELAEIISHPSKNITTSLQQMADNTGLVKIKQIGKLKSWYK